MNKDLIEGIKQILRTALLSIIPLVISALSSGEGNIDWRAIAIAGVIALLSGLDKLLHESGVKSPLDMKGGFIDNLAK